MAQRDAAVPPLANSLVASLCLAVTREFNKTTTGRLNNGVPQVPPRRGESDLNQFRQTLPVFHMRQEIMAIVNSHQVSLISGETGSGKTTQVTTVWHLSLSLWDR